MPYASAFIAIVSDALCWLSGTEIAHWLFWQMSTHGAFSTAAKFMPAWKSFELVAPSPR